MRKRSGGHSVGKGRSPPRRESAGFRTPRLPFVVVDRFSTTTPRNPFRPTPVLSPLPPTAHPPTPLGIFMTNIVLCAMMVRRIKRVESTLPVEYLQRVGYLQVHAIESTLIRQAFQCRLLNLYAWLPRDSLLFQQPFQQRCFQHYITSIHILSRT